MLVQQQNHYQPNGSKSFSDEANDHRVKLSGLQGCGQGRLELQIQYVLAPRTDVLRMPQQSMFRFVPQRNRSLRAC
ncbi:MAG: hypothetical protein EZS28_012430 [Streblomastix strix]|uniref:Uncharacterized protein n=1 Tax=Streblomastix strix TaxID=222440 RepID=A0A5J4WAW3_9EUKA|nr:MAG: hypothetical protein EZS28_012430 [Streblomastix strix]